MVVTAIAVLVGVVRTEASGDTVTIDAPALLEAATSLVFDDGDHVVFTPEAKGTAAPQGPVVHEGFTTYGDAMTLPRYDIRLVESQGIEDLRTHLAGAADDAMAAGAPALVLQPGTVPSGTQLERGQIHVIVSSSSPCRGTWLGCGGPIIDEGKVVAAQIWLNPRLLERDVSQIDNTSRHELGHSLGLGHFNGIHDGRTQTMHPTSFDAQVYESGDRAGFRFVTGTTGPDPQRAGGSMPGSANARVPAPPPDADPAGHVDVVESTPFGVVIRGQAIDPDSSRPVSVLITVDGAPIETLANSASESGSGGDGRFEVVHPVGPGAHEVCVLVRNAGEGKDLPLGCRTIQVNGQSIGRIGLQTV